MGGQDCGQLTLFPADSPASHSVWPGSGGARRMTVTSSLKCLELSRSSGPLGSLVRMLLESSAWRSTRCFLTWKASVTPHRRLLFRLVPSTLRTEETEFLSWEGTENRVVYFIPTPRAHNIPTSKKAKRKYKSSPSLTDYVLMFPTPKAQNCRGNGEKHGEGGQSLDVSVGGRLNPTWVEWLMGFPLGWTDCSASETQ